MTLTSRIIWAGLCASAAACAHIERPQARWWHAYGAPRGCAVIGESEHLAVGRRGRVREVPQTCYRCPQEPAPICFAGPPVPGAPWAPAEAITGAPPGVPAAPH